MEAKSVQKQRIYEDAPSAMRLTALFVVLGRSAGLFVEDTTISADPLKDFSTLIVFHRLESEEE